MDSLSVVICFADSRVVFEQGECSSTGPSSSVEICGIIPRIAVVPGSIFSGQNKSAEVRDARPTTPSARGPLLDITQSLPFLFRVLGDWSEPCQCILVVPVPQSRSSATENEEAGTVCPRDIRMPGNELAGQFHLLITHWFTNSWSCLFFCYRIPVDLYPAPVKVMSPSSWCILPSGIHCFGDFCMFIRLPIHPPIRRSVDVLASSHLESWDSPQFSLRKRIWSDYSSFPGKLRKQAWWSLFFKFKQNVFTQFWNIIIESVIQYGLRRFSASV